MNQTNAVSEMKAIDWTSIFEKLPQFAVLMKQLLDLFMQKQPMGLTAQQDFVKNCPAEVKEHLLTHLKNQNEALVKSLCDNVCMQSCVETK